MLGLKFRRCPRLSRGPRGFTKCAHHRLSRAGAETVGHHDYVFRGFMIQVVWMDDEKTDALEIGCLLG